MNSQTYQDRIGSIDSLFKVMTAIRDIGGALMVGKVMGQSTQPFWKLYNYKAIDYRPYADNVLSVVASKYAELLRYYEYEGATPCLYPYTDPDLWVTGYPGGIKTEIGGTAYIGAFSGAPGAHDVLMAALALTVLSCGPVVINHHGSVAHYEDAYLETVSRWNADLRHTVSADILYGCDNPHKRTYAGFYLDGEWVCMEEVQLWPFPIRSLRVEHLDVAPVLCDAETFYRELRRIATLASSKVTVTYDWWGDTRPGPLGQVATYDPKRSFEFAIHVRETGDAYWTPKGLKWEY